MMEFWREELITQVIGHIGDQYAEQVPCGFPECQGSAYKHKYGWACESCGLWFCESCTLRKDGRGHICEPGDGSWYCEKCQIHCQCSSIRKEERRKKIESMGLSFKFNRVIKTLKVSKNTSK